MKEEILGNKENKSPMICLKKPEWLGYPDQVST